VSGVNEVVDEVVVDEDVESDPVDVDVEGFELELVVGVAGEVVVVEDEVDVDVVVGPTGRSFAAGENPRRAESSVESLPSMPSAQMPIPPRPLDSANCVTS
jgi:hypothetical protein